MASVDQTISLGNSRRDTSVKETTLTAHGGWAIATDGIQWILQKARGDGRWRSVSFVRTSKDTLRHCCRENGVTDIEALLEPLSDYFPGWDADAEAFAAGYFGSDAVTGAEVDRKLAKLIRSPDGSISFTAIELHAKHEAARQAAEGKEEELSPDTFRCVT